MCKRRSKRERDFMLEGKKLKPIKFSSKVSMVINGKSCSYKTGVINEIAFSCSNVTIVTVSVNKIIDSARSGETNGSRINSL